MNILNIVPLVLLSLSSVYAWEAPTRPHSVDEATQDSVSADKPTESRIQREINQIRAGLRSTGRDMTGDLSAARPSRGGLRHTTTQASAKQDSVSADKPTESRIQREINQIRAGLRPTGRDVTGDLSPARRPSPVVAEGGEQFHMSQEELDRARGGLRRTERDLTR